MLCGMCGSAACVFEDSDAWCRECYIGYRYKHISFGEKREEDAYNDGDFVSFRAQTAWLDDMTGICPLCGLCLACSSAGYDPDGDTALLDKVCTCAVDSTGGKRYIPGNASFEHLGEGRVRVHINLKPCVLLPSRVGC